jgi:hypothetical protein
MAPLCVAILCGRVGAMSDLQRPTQKKSKMLKSNLLVALALGLGVE